MKKTSAFKLSQITLATAVAMGAMTTAPIALAEGLSTSGNIGVFSKYVLRGYQKPAEATGPVLQGGLDLEHSSGVYAGYWGSNLGYSDDADKSGFENDVYAGFGGEVAGVSYSIGGVYYKYLNISDADAPELVASVGYGPVSVGLNYLLSDVLWGNTGDMYWTANFEQALPKGFTLSATAGYYMYADSGEFIASTPIDSGFRHLNVSLSHPIGNTGADMILTGIYGGVDRNDVDQGSTAVLGVTYGFDI